MIEVLSILFIVLILFPLLLIELIGIVCMTYTFKIRRLMTLQELPKDMWKDFT